MGVVADVASWLETAGLTGGSTGWVALRRRLTDTPQPDQVVVVREDGGPTPEMAAPAGELGDAAMVDVGVFVLVRGQPSDSDGSYAKAQAIYNALHGARGVLVGAHQYLRVHARTPEPIFVGFDALGRPQHTIGFQCLRDA